MTSVRAMRALVAGMLLSACTHVPFDATRAPSYARAPDGVSWSAPAALSDRPQQALFAPLVDGNEALGARLRMIESARHSIDIQTFLIKPDVAGTLLWLALYEAAERGVRVRLLYDDVFTTAQDDQIATLDAHPNAELRVFNPLSRNSTLVMNFVLDFNRVNRRMHNKAMIVDGARAIVGGRNIADEYYQINTSNEFADFDLYLEGAAVRDLSVAFDRYWNDPWALPLAALEDGDDTDLRAAVAQFRAEAALPERQIYARAVHSRLLAGLRAGRTPVYGGRARVVVDDPGKLRKPPGKGPYLAGEALYQALNRARRRVVIVTPYFVPEDYGERFLVGLMARGVEVVIVTNSLASTNHAYVHGGYAPYRNRLLRAGARIFEVRADAPALVEGNDATFTMHSKLAIIDGAAVFVGSTNIDPRSIRQNAEIGMVIDSPAMAAALEGGIKRSLDEYTFAVVPDEDRGRTWVYRGAAGAEVFDSEPGAGFWRRVVATVTGWLPVEQQL